MGEEFHYPAAQRAARALGLVVYSNRPELVTILAPARNGRQPVKGFVMRGLGIPCELEVVLELVAVAREAGIDPALIEAAVSAVGY